MSVFQGGNTKFCRVDNREGMNVTQRDMKKLENRQPETLWNLIKIDIKSCIWDVLSVCNSTASGCHGFSKINKIPLINANFCRLMKFKEAVKNNN